MKKILLILIGLSFTLGGIIYILYRNNEEKDEVVENIFKEETIEKTEMQEEKEEVKEDTRITVDIKGMINNPGVYEIEAGKRINDVIIMAGGLLEEADTSNINLAKKVFDEMTIIIYSKEEVLEKYKQEVCTCDCSYITNDACIIEEEISNNTKININTATKEELITIPGLGETKALAIIEYKNKTGNFTSIEQIKEVSGIGEAIFEKIKDYITI